MIWSYGAFLRYLIEPMGSDEGAGARRITFQALTAVYDFREFGRRFAGIRAFQEENKLPRAEEDLI
jgi:hypothetical protein